MSLATELRQFIAENDGPGMVWAGIRELKQILNSNRPTPAPKASLYVRHACGHEQELRQGRDLFEASGCPCDSCWKSKHVPLNTGFALNSL